MAKKSTNTQYQPIPTDTNPKGILLWDIALLTRIANDLNTSLGLLPSIVILPAEYQTDQSMQELQRKIIEAVKLTNL